MPHHYNHNSLNALPFLTLELGYLTLQIIAIFGSNFSANQHDRGSPCYIVIRAGATKEISAITTRLI